MNKKILLVDDCPFILKVMDDMLCELKYDVTSFTCSLKAYAQVLEKKFDLIITDLHMPGMDGIEFTRKVKATPNCRFVPVVMLSSEGDADKIADAKKMGISTFLQKPVKEAQLKAILQIAVGALDNPASSP